MLVKLRFINACRNKRIARKNIRKFCLYKGKIEYWLLNKYLITLYTHYSLNEADALAK